MASPNARSLSLIDLAAGLANDARFYADYDSDYAAEAAAMILRNVYMSDPQLEEELARRATEMSEEGAARRIVNALHDALAIFNRS